MSVKRVCEFFITAIVGGILYSGCLTPVMAQNVTCPTRPLGDNSNACASTAFVNQNSLTNPFTGNLVLNPTSGDALTINTALGTTAKGFNITQTGPNTGSTGAPVFYNEINVIDGTNVTGGQFGIALGVFQQLTSNINGQKSALYVASLRNTAQTATTGDQIGAVFFAQASVSNGGTNTGAGASGTIYAINPIFSGLTGANNYAVWSGGEVDMNATGGSTSRRLGWTIANAGTVQGVNIDTAFEVTSTNNAGAFKNVLTFTGWRTGGAANYLDPAASLFADDGLVNQTITGGINLPNWTFTGNVINVKNVTLSGAGALTLGAVGNLGSVALKGNTSGTATIQPQATAGTPTLTLPNTSGTFAVSASAPLALSTTTGALTVTGAAGQVLAGSTPAFTATPTLGVASSATGTLTLATSGGAGTGTLQYATSASSATLTLPATTSTLAGLAVTQTFTAAQTFGAASAQITVTGSSTPQIIFTPSTGTTKNGEFYQQGDQWFIASVGVANWFGVNLGNGAFGYQTSAGGAVTQITSRTTGVTLNKPTGQITMFTAAGSTTPASFTVTNSTVAATDTISLSITSGASNTYDLTVSTVSAGSFVITFYTTGGVASDTPIINFNVIKGANS